MRAVRAVKRARAAASRSRIPSSGPRTQKSIVTTASDAFVGMDADGLITEWNQRAVALFGWARDEVIGRALAETIIPARSRDVHREGLRRVNLIVAD